MQFRLILLIMAMVILPGTMAHAGEKGKIELNDGTVISGEVLSLSGGVYTIKSDSLGVLKLDASKIKAIRMKDPVQPSREQPIVQSPQHATDVTAQTKSLEERMMADEEIMDMISSLQNDPEFKKAMEDPEILRAVNSGDIAALNANPRFMNLLNNRTVKEIKEKTMK